MKLACTLALLSDLHLAAAGVVFEGKRGPGKGKHVVLVSGDEEYRSVADITDDDGKLLARVTQTQAVLQG